MNTTQTTLALPTSKKERVIIIDSLRGFALCGILLMNIPFFGMPYYQVQDPRLLGELTQQANHFWWAFINYFLEGSMRGLFSILFGAGSVLLIERLSVKHAGLTAADIYFRRLLWLLLFGLINGFLLNWPGDILFHYSIVGMFIFPFRKASKSLLAGFVACIVLLTIAFGFVEKRELFEMRNKGIAAEKLENAGKLLNEKQQEDLKAWQDFQQETNPAENQKKAEKVKQEISKGSYADVFGKFSSVTAKIESKDFYSSMFFDIILFFLLGILLFKTGIITGEKPLVFYAVLSLLGYCIGVSIGYLTYRADIAANFDYFGYYQQGGLPVDLYQVHRIGTTLGHLGLVMLLYKTGLFNWLLTPLAAMGQMAFTNYLGQSVICSLLFYGYGFGLYGQLQRFELYYVWGGIILFQLIFSMIWLRFFRFGPLEWVWRSLTYWKRQPLKKNAEPMDMP